MALYTVQDTSLVEIADAIRTKGDTSSSLVFPGGFVSAINNISTSSPIILKTGVLRPDAELVKTFSYDKHIVADENITLPAYTTTATTLLASSELAETYTIDYTNYNWYVLIRTLTIPEYNIASKAKGRTEYHLSSTMYEVIDLAAGVAKALIDPTVGPTSRSANLTAMGVTARLIYWSSGTAVSAYNTTAYGTGQAIVAPTLASDVLTFNTPNLNIRGSTTYLTSTYMNAITDIRYQWIIEIWKAPKNNLNLDGWGQLTQMYHILDCVQGTNHKLT